jgi:hypothetical protein
MRAIEQRLAKAVREVETAAESEYRRGHAVTGATLPGINREGDLPWGGNREGDLPWGGEGSNRVKEGAESNLSRNITKTSELNNNMLKGLKNKGTINAGGRSGGSRPLTGTPNSYGTTPAGHTLVYDLNGRLIYDISPQRVKMTVWDQAPNGNLFPRDVKLEGAVPDGLLVR